MLLIVIIITSVESIISGRIVSSLVKARSVLESVLDETPMAYKDIDAVMAAQADLVEIVHTLKQILCIKG